MKDIVIAGSVRTPVGSHGGGLRSLRAQDLAEIVFRAVFERTGVDAAALDGVILGNIAQPSDAANIGRVAGLMAGVPMEVPGFTVARNFDRKTLSESEFEISRSVVLQVSRDGQPLLTNNALMDPRFQSHQSIVAYKLRSILCVPLTVN